MDFSRCWCNPWLTHPGEFPSTVSQALGKLKTYYDNWVAAKDKPVAKRARTENSGSGDVSAEIAELRKTVSVLETTIPGTGRGGRHWTGRCRT